MKIIKLLYCLSLLISQSIGKQSIRKYLNYGNELNQIDYYYNNANNYELYINNLTFLSNVLLDPIEYMKSFKLCHKFDAWCIRGKNSEHRLLNSTLYQPIYLSNDKLYRHLPDCKYNISLDSSYLLDDIYNNNSYIHKVYKFIIKESNCQSKFNLINGGSSFIFTAYNDVSIISCNTIDHFNNLYILICKFPLIQSIHFNIINDHINLIDYPSCIYLTGLLEYEHYDQYSIALASESLYDFLYPTLNTVLLNNQTFCSNELAIKRINDNVFNNLSIYSGYWVNSDIFKNHNSFVPHKDSMSSYEYKKQYNQIYTYTNNLTNQLPNQQYNYIPIHVNPANISTIDTFINYTKLLDNNTVYHFLGESHLRYTYDIIIGKLFNESKLPQSRKFGNSHYNNFYYNIDFNNTEKFYNGLFSNILGRQIVEICNKNLTYNNNNDTNSNHVFIIQFGSWNLWQSPIQISILSKDAYYIPKVLYKLLSKELLCSNLKHIIWISSMPYPLCLNVYDDYCFNLRGFNNNGAEAVYNSFIYEFLHNITSYLQIKLTIIDAYSIIKPRLLLNNDNEVICSNHYLCRDIYNNKYVNIYTPGGLAVVETLLHVLSNDV